MQWKKILKNNFTNLDHLADFLQLSDADRKQLLLQKKSFPLFLPFRLAQKMQKGTLKDPILKQYVPLNQESINLPGYQKDPVEDNTFKITDKLLQKYNGRVLLLTTGACAMHCRFCFRQNYDYVSSKTGFQKELNWIKNNPHIYEVILSGGDPLSLSDEILEELLKSLNDIRHIKFIRFHTRFIIGIPERITNSLLSFFSNCKKQIYFVLHINHYLELDPAIEKVLKKLQAANVQILSQTVLLKDINDNVFTLKNLFFHLSSIGVQPYYLHQFDKINGGHHFYVNIEKGKELMQELLAVLPGYAVPRYVQEIPRKKNKVPIF